MRTTFTDGGKVMPKPPPRIEVGDGDRPEVGEDDRSDVGEGVDSAPVVDRGVGVADAVFRVVAVEVRTAVGLTAVSDEPLLPQPIAPMVSAASSSRGIIPRP